MDARRYSFRDEVMLFAVAAKQWTLGCDANDPHRLADFWPEALGYVAETGLRRSRRRVDHRPEGKGPAIGWLRVPEEKSAKNRLHVDIRVLVKDRAT